MKRTLTVSPAVQNFRATVSLGIVTLSWDDITEEGYFSTVIYRSTTNDRTTAVAIDTAQESSQFTDNGLTSEVTYYYWALTSDIEGKVNSAWSSDVNAGLPVTVPLVQGDETDLDSFYEFTKDFWTTGSTITSRSWSDIHKVSGIAGKGSVVSYRHDVYVRMSSNANVIIGTKSGRVYVQFQLRERTNGSYVTIKQSSQIVCFEVIDNFPYATHVGFGGYETLEDGKFYEVAVRAVFEGDTVGYDVDIVESRIFVKNYQVGMVQPAIASESL